MTFHQRFGRRLLVALGLLLFTAGVAVAVVKVEKFPDGKERARYTVDKDGHPHGKYTEFFENGKTRVKGTFRHGQRHGKYTEYHSTGKKRIVATYRNGKLHGEFKSFNERGKTVSTETYLKGTLIFPRSVSEIRKGLARIYSAKIRPPKPKGPKGKLLSFEPLEWKHQINLLKRLRAHRFLCEVPIDV